MLSDRHADLYREVRRKPEPTSGLDPGYEKSVMQTLRTLADDGRS